VLTFILDGRDQPVDDIQFKHQILALPPQTELLQCPERILPEECLGRFGRNDVKQQLHHSLGHHLTPAHWVWRYSIDQPDSLLFDFQTLVLQKDVHDHGDVLLDAQFGTRHSLLVASVVQVEEVLLRQLFNLRLGTAPWGIF